MRGGGAGLLACFPIRNSLMVAHFRERHLWKRELLYPETGSRPAYSVRGLVLRTKLSVQSAAGQAFTVHATQVTECAHPPHSLTTLG